MAKHFPQITAAATIPIPTTQLDPYPSASYQAQYSKTRANKHQAAPIIFFLCAFLNLLGPCSSTVLAVGALKRQLTRIH
jgi:hypothetical protein